MSDDQDGGSVFITIRLPGEAKQQGQWEALLEAVAETVYGSVAEQFEPAVFGWADPRLGAMKDRVEYVLTTHQPIGYPVESLDWICRCGEHVDPDDFPWHQTKALFEENSALTQGRILVGVWRSQQKRFFG